MGYFPNGTAGEIYRERYCERCVHDINQDCPVLLAHLLKNYDECNKPDSILHLLIPRSKSPEIGNEQCKLFWPRAAVRDLFEPALPGNGG